MEPTDIQRHRLEVVLNTQFPHLDAGSLINEITIQISRKTRRIRSVYSSDGTLIFSLRTNDGRYIPTFAGGKAMLEVGYEGQRVVVNDDAAPFVAAGKSVFCKHVLKVDQDVRPGSEVLVFSQSQDFLAVGIANQPGYAMLQLQSGVAVKNKHCRDKANADS